MEPVAHRLERNTDNVEVVGSIPSWLIMIEEKLLKSYKKNKKLHGIELTLKGRLNGVPRKRIRKINVLGNSPQVLSRSHYSKKDIIKTQWGILSLNVVLSYK